MITIRPMTPEDIENMMAAENADRMLHLLPAEYLKPLQRYIEDGILPGGFLTAVLENDLKSAMARADLFNRRRVYEYSSWLYNNAPMGCWGSRENVREWVSRRRAEAMERGR